VATPQGLLAAAFETSASGGELFILGCPSMTVLSRLNLEVVPESLRLEAQRDGPGYLSVGLSKGGMQLFQLAP
jgi:hypothetical protein